MLLQGQGCIVHFYWAVGAEFLVEREKLGGAFSSGKSKIFRSLDASKWFNLAK